ncbi:MAG: hypothetical protein KAT70_08010 [Thermoplasmata archaeon]|nr:hypothetical protein [Thermoplasmata archaeon]
MPPKDEILSGFQKIGGMDKAKAEALYDNGFTSWSLLQDALMEELLGVDGFNEELADRVILQAQNKVKKEAGEEEDKKEEEKAVEGKTEKGKEEDKKEEAKGKGKEEQKAGTGETKGKPKKEDKKKAGGQEKKGGGKEDLEDWLSGDDEGGDALESWLRGGEETLAGAPDKKEKTESGKKDKSKMDGGKKEEKTEKEGEKKEEKAKGEEGKPSADAAPKEEGQGALKKWLAGDADGGLEEWLTEEPEEETAGEDIHFDAESLGDIQGMVKNLVKGIKSGKTDVVKVVSENAALKHSLSEEMNKREETERELENVKKSSVAVVKYIKAQQAKLKGKDTAKLQSMLDKQAMVKEKLEIKLRETEMEVKTLKEELEKKIENLAPDEKEVMAKELELIEMKKELGIKEKTLLQKEEALASGEGILLREMGGEGLGGSGSAEMEQAWQDEKNLLLNEKAEAEKKLEEAILEKGQMAEQLKHSGMDEGVVNQELAIREKELANQEKECSLRISEVDDLKRNAAMKDEEIMKLRESVAFKEEELLRREEDLMHREKLIEAEHRKVEEAKKGIGTLDQQDAQKRLEALKHDIADKERELKAKEKYMRAKEEELKYREKGVIEDELEAREEDRKIEWKIEKVKLGVQRLDDLMLGGMPFGSNVAIYGPPFMGKETLMDVFLAEGLKKGIPAVWIVTDKSPSEVREEMSFVISGYEEYEKMGLVKYIDTYSISMGEEEDDPNTIYISDITETKEILKAVDKVCKELKKEHKYYRLAFRSVSTLVAYMGATEAFKFLQPFTGRRKRDKAVSMYAIEKGMHKDEEIQSISHTMDGTIDFKSEQLKSYLAIQGIGDVQSRSFVEYTHSKQSINIGSFSLDHIR